MKVGFVLVVDIVAYSLLTTTKQKEAVTQLADLLDGCTSYAEAHKEVNVIKCPAGDGFILVFDDPEPALTAAIELLKQVSHQAPFQIREAIHYGAVDRVIRPGEPENVSGEAVNMAARAAGVAQPAELLLTQRAFELYSEFGDWADRFAEIGSHRVKHGKKLVLYQFLIRARVKQPLAWERYLDQAKRIRAREEAKGNARLATEGAIARRIADLRSDMRLGLVLVAFSVLALLVVAHTGPGRDAQIRVDSVLQSRVPRRPGA